MGTADRAMCQLPIKRDYDPKRLEQVFARCFAARWRTRLRGGAEEPVYRPAEKEGDYHLLYYRSDYFASALHEVAHWCIAGKRRRALSDFGYWYAADGRSVELQRAFEAVEYKPQALEWWFSRACGYRFGISLDNLDGTAGELPDTDPFKQSIVMQARHWQCEGLPARAGLFYAGLSREFGTQLAPGALHFSRSELD